MLSHALQFQPPEGGESMTPMVTKREAQKLIGKQIFAVKKDGSFVTGKLVRIKGNQLMISNKSGKATTQAIIPLVLFDLLAIGTSPFGYGYGYPYDGGFGGGYGYGYPGFW
jgi:hypothetical protein